MSITFLPTITTITPGGWRGKVGEIDRLGIKEAAVFPTCLEFGERRELYAALEQTKLKSVPFVHIRSDMSASELDYFIKRWKTRVFNIHPPGYRPLAFDPAPYRDKIYIENIDTKDQPKFIWREEEIAQFAGICIDFTHMEANRLLYPDRFERNTQIIAKFPCGCAHISAITPALKFDPYTKMNRYDFHRFENLNEFDYLRNYPRGYFPKYAALELENSLAEQLKAKQYIEVLLK